MLRTIVILIAFGGAVVRSQYAPPISRDPPASCYTDSGVPQRCIPEFENAAYGVQMEATNTCGDNGPITYCIQTSNTQKPCNLCQPGEFQSYFLTDLHHETDNQTWWQSETMKEGIQYPNKVNLTLKLGKSFDITYVRIVFYSPRPESFAIYKRTTEDGDWEPYQYYSASCRDTYGLPDSLETEQGAETRALCTGEYSDISPTRGGNVAFSTLEGRPSAYSFDTSPPLQQWVAATSLRISLDRLNTFGDEVFGDPKVLQSYSYAIADVAVGARCKCNGHASKCNMQDDGTGRRFRRCLCEHNTDGPDCDKCLDFYNDAPWGRASQHNVNECKACSCNGYSNRCFFDKQLYDRTGHGGHCLDCTENRDGPNCERCKENYYQRSDGLCIPCHCDAIGSRSLQCNSDGKCQCKPGVVGEKCDLCAPNHFDFTTSGCKNCGCFEPGSFRNQPVCDFVNGDCRCKDNVEGKRCKQCKPGFFNLNLNNRFGCTPCFCYGHSSECQSAPGYSKVTIESSFTRNNDKWTAQNVQRNSINMMYNAQIQNIAVSASSEEPVYFVAPDRFLGDQRASYNHDLKFNFRIGDSPPYPTSSDVILEGAGKHVEIAIFGQNNIIPNVKNTEFTFRLHEHQDYGWSPKLSASDFMSILSNLTSIRIRGTYSKQGVGFLDDVRLETAYRGAAGEPALWVEMCRCPQGYIGQFCESCDSGFRHSPALGGPFKPCIPCDCNKHADNCDSETGRCICQHNTAGDNCELCKRGYYGNALSGTSDDCKKCPCPDNGACIQMPDQLIICTECPTGYAGFKCDLCSDGYYGDPMGRSGLPQACQSCDCNLNVDPNAVGNCNRTSGECLKCIYNTAGEHCDRCLTGYYGDALGPIKGDCHPCECYRTGTYDSAEGPSKCNQLTGQCACRPHVKGRNCDLCEDGYYNIASGEGCERCNCNLEGSYNHTCNIITGQCQCKPGVTGRMCDQCRAEQYGFSQEGCKECKCDSIGSKALQCNPDGQCPCYDNVEGRQCNRCKENKHDRQRGCIDCPSCYNLVQQAVNIHRSKIRELEKMLREIENSPTVIPDSDFDTDLENIKLEIDQLEKQAQIASGAGDGQKSLVQRINDLDNRLENIKDLISGIADSTEKGKLSSAKSAANITAVEEIIEASRKELNNAFNYLETDGAVALTKAQNRSDQFGQQSTQMSVIAQESRLLAENLEKEAKNIKDIAATAYNTSSEAYKLAKGGLGQQANISNELRLLSGEISAAKGKLKNIQEMAAQSLARSLSVYEDALDIYAKVNSTNTLKIDPKKMRSDAELMLVEAYKLKQSVEQFKDENSNHLKEFTKELELSANLSDRAIRQQEELQDMLTQLDVIHSQAKEAVKEGNSTLEEATAIYDTLKKFHDQVQTSKQEAERAIDTIPNIQDTVRLAEDKTASVVKDLDMAGVNATKAYDIAQQAQMNYAQNASEKAHEIRKKAAATKLNAGTLHDEAGQLSGRVAETARQIKVLEKNADYDAQLTGDAKVKAGQAKTDAYEAQKLVQKALDDVKNITEELQNLPFLDDKDLDTLERHLKEAEKEFKRANLTDRIQNLQEARNTHQRWIKDYQDEADRLDKEVINVKSILDALPAKCNRVVILEP